MKKLKLKEGVEVCDEPIYDPDERKGAEHLVEVCKQHGYEIELLTARDAWSEHSQEYCASWLRVSGDPERLVQIILHYTEVMKKLKLKQGLVDHTPFLYGRADYETESDAKLIEVMKARGYELTPEEAYKVWLAFSRRCDASWMTWSGDDADVEEYMRFMEEVPE